MLLSFLGTSGALLLIFMSAQNEQNIRLWETNRLRGYECLFEHQYNAAGKFFRKASDASKTLGKEDYRYAVSLEDTASLNARASQWDKADKFTRKAMDIYAKKTNISSGQGILFLEDKLLAACRLTEFDLAARKNTDGIWRDLSNATATLLSAGSVHFDPFVIRRVCLTMMNLADVCGKDGNVELQRTICAEVLALSQKFETMKDLSRGTQRHLHAVYSSGQSWESILNTIPAMIKAHDSIRAKDALQQVKEMAVNSDGEIPVEVRMVEIKYYLSIEDYEEAERLLLQQISKKGPSDEALDDCFTRLVMIYRICGYRSDLASALRRQWEWRKNFYGATNSKSMSCELDYAIALHQMGEIDAARPHCEHLLKAMQSSDFAVEKTEHLAAALIRNGDNKTAKEILDELVDRFSMQKKKKLILATVSAFFDYGALELMQGNKSKAEAAIKQGLSMDEGFASYSYVELADKLTDWAYFLASRNGNELYIRNAILIMPVPVFRKDAIREAADIAVLETLHAKCPSAFNTEVKQHLAKIQAGIKNFSPVKLIGFSQKSP
jgi:hypothetical protein